MKTRTALLVAAIGAAAVGNAGASCPLPNAPTVPPGRSALIDAAIHVDDIGRNVFEGEVSLGIDLVDGRVPKVLPKSVSVGTVLVLAGRFASVRPDDTAVAEAIGAGTAFNELTFVGAMRVAEIGSGAGPHLGCFRFEPLEHDAWESAGLDPPSGEGTLLRVFDDASNDFDDTVDVATTLARAQNGMAIYELGFSDTDAVAASGEGADARPQTSIKLRPQLNFLTRATLRLALGLTVGPQHAWGTALLPVGFARAPFGGPSDALFALDEWRSFTPRPGWHLFGRAAMTLRLLGE